MDLYIYYRVRCDRADLFCAQANRMQATLVAEHGLTAALKRRPDEKDGHHTWMEVYQNIPENFDATLQRLVTQTGLLLLIDGERHIEHFLDLSACA